MSLFARFGNVERTARLYHTQTHRTALVWAAAKGRTDCMRLLLDAGAQIEAKYDSIVR